MRARKLALALAVASALSPAGAQQQGPVRMIVPFGAGGSADAVARVVADDLRRSGAFNLIIENMPGASGKIAAEACSRAEADGRTVCLGQPATHTIPLLSASPEATAYLRRQVPVAMLGTQPLVISVHAQVPARSAAEFLQWLRRNPDATYSTSGVGTLSNLVVLALASELGVKPTHVPYRSGEASTLAAATGQVAFTINQFASVRPHLASGKLVPVAVTGRGRLALLPGVATLSEVLGGEMEFRTYLGFFAPEGVGEGFARGFYEALKASASQPETAARLASLGLEPEVRPSGEFAASLAREEALWRRIVRAHGIRIE
jgi:tripartite-type tricarboxylate transporter receptor subunit TctC